MSLARVWYQPVVGFRCRAANRGSSCNTADPDQDQIYPSNNRHSSEKLYRCERKDVQLGDFWNNTVSYVFSSQSGHGMNSSKYMKNNLESNRDKKKEGDEYLSNLLKYGTQNNLQLLRIEESPWILYT
jgi:hypothetical protein